MIPDIQARIDDEHALTLAALRSRVRLPGARGGQLVIAGVLAPRADVPPPAPPEEPAFREAVRNGVPCRLRGLPPPGLPLCYGCTRQVILYLRERRQPVPPGYAWVDAAPTVTAPYAAIAPLGDSAPNTPPDVIARNEATSAKYVADRAAWIAKLQSAPADDPIWAAVFTAVRGRPPRFCEDCGCRLGDELGALEYHRAGCPRFPL